mgnify:FL=1
MKHESIDMTDMTEMRVAAFTMIAVMLIAVIGGPASAQAADAKQPSVDNPQMHIWGTDNIGQCWTHFDANETTSAVDGYGEKEFAQNQQVDVNFNCAMSESFKDDMYLNPNGTIRIDVGVYVQSGDCSDTAECQELRISLMKGSTVVAVNEFATNSFEDEQVIWEIPVADNMTRWNKSFEEPQLQFEYSKPNPGGLECIVFDCTGVFRLYYSNNQDGMNTEILFPVINASDPIAVGGDDAPPSTGDSGLLPGFGLLAGVGSLAIGAAAASKLNRKD